MSQNEKIALSHILQNLNWRDIRKQLQGFISQSLFTQMNPDSEIIVQKLLKTYISCTRLSNDKLYFSFNWLEFPVLIFSGFSAWASIIFSHLSVKMQRDSIKKFHHAHYFHDIADSLSLYGQSSSSFQIFLFFCLFPKNSSPIFISVLPLSSRWTNCDGTATEIISHFQSSLCNIKAELTSKAYYIQRWMATTNLMHKKVGLKLGKTCFLLKIAPPWFNSTHSGLFSPIVRFYSLMLKTVCLSIERWKKKNNFAYQLQVLKSSLSTSKHCFLFNCDCVLSSRGSMQAARE